MSNHILQKKSKFLFFKSRKNKFKEKPKRIFKKKKKSTKIFQEVGFQPFLINIQLKRFHGQLDIPQIVNMNKFHILDNNKIF